MGCALLFCCLMGLELRRRVLRTYDFRDFAPNYFLDAVQSLHLFDEIKQFRAASDKYLRSQIDLDFSDGASDEDDLLEL